MIECYPRVPSVHRMTLIALLTQLAFVYIARAMAADAIMGQLLTGDGRRVACVAFHFNVPSGEFPVTIACVIEGSRLPLLVTMALSAVRTETPGV